MSESQAAATGPPPTRRGDVVETLHGHEVADPYRWLEDPDSAQTAAWVVAQNTASRAHLDTLAARPWFRETMRRIVGSPRAGTPHRIGPPPGQPGHATYVVSRHDADHQQDRLFAADTLEELAAGGRLLVDPNTFSADGTSSLAGYQASRDGRLLAYLVSDGGSDWTSIHVIETATGRAVDDPVTKVKFSDATWLPDGSSFLYLHYAVAGEGVGTEAAALPAGVLRRHRVGTAQDQDEVVLTLPDEPRVNLTPWLSHDGRWLAVHLTVGTSEQNRLWVYPVATPSGGASVLGEPVRLVDETYAGFEAVRADGAWLHLLTDHEAPLRRLVRVDLDAATCGDRPELVEVVPESEHLLEHAAAVGEGLVLSHLVDAAPRLSRCTLEQGRVVDRREVDVTGGKLVALHGSAGDPEVFVGLSTVVTPVASYRIDLRDGSLTPVDLVAAGAGSGPGASVWRPPTVDVERRRATSRDGTQVPYFLVRPGPSPAGGPTGPRPTLLWGYGGFAISEAASYRATFAGWLAAGGTLAIANLRGGGEFGTAWHDAGRLELKQNVFDDYAAVAEHLVSEGLTTPGQLALHGGSNGGLLVGATLAQRPGLAAVALPAVGVLDMLRFHLFTIGSAWISDYGSPEDPEMFEVLRAYSPLHTLVPGTAYPATLVLTGDHDDRVVPAHSFKFTAELQHCQGGPAPVLARIETSAGHGSGKAASVVVEETADLLAFAAEHTGLRPGG